MTSHDIAFIDGRKLSREEISAGLDVPISLLDPTAIRANVEGAQYFHAKYGIEPRLRKIEEKINERLMPLYGSGDTLFVAFDDVVPADKEFALRKRTADIQAGVSTINEERSIDGKEPVDGGDEPLVGFGLTPLSQVVAEPEPVPDALKPLVGGGGAGDGAGDKPKPKPDAADEEAVADEDAEDLAKRTLRALRKRLGDVV